MIRAAFTIKHCPNLCLWGPADCADASSKTSHCYGKRTIGFSKRDVVFRICRDRYIQSLIQCLVNNFLYHTFQFQSLIESSARLVQSMTIVCDRLNWRPFFSDKRLCLPVINCSFYSNLQPQCLRQPNFWTCVINCKQWKSS